MAQARASGWMPTCLAVYGSGGELGFAGVWEGNLANVAWHADGLGEPSAAYQGRFDAELACWARPALVTLSSDEQYASIFRDDQIGPVVARHGMTSGGYQAEFDRLVPQGFFPIWVQGGGAGRGTRFAALFAREQPPEALVWQSPTGPTEVPALDDVMRDAMARHRIRGAGLALVHGGRLV
jgi:Polyglycine hydrolase-like, structural repeat